jgi:hypothetical protein
MVMALTSNSVLPLSAIVAVALLAVGLVIAFVVKAVVMKVLGLVVTVVLALALWSQRAELNSCADKITAGVQDISQAGDISCHFFGRDIDVPLPSGSSVP